MYGPTLYSNLPRAFSPPTAGFPLANQRVGISPEAMRMEISPVRTGIEHLGAHHPRFYHHGDGIAAQGGQYPYRTGYHQSLHSTFPTGLNPARAGFPVSSRQGRISQEAMRVEVDPRRTGLYGKSNFARDLVRQNYPYNQAPPSTFLDGFGLSQDNAAASSADTGYGKVRLNMSKGNEAFSDEDVPAANASGAQPDVQPGPGPMIHHEDPPAEEEEGYTERYMNWAKENPVVATALVGGSVYALWWLISRNR